MPALIPTRKLAEKILVELMPFCERAEVAGSIRRARDWVNDIDLVLQPKAGKGLALLDRCQRSAALVKSGPQNAVLRLANGVQLDLWIAHGELPDLLAPQPTNWGAKLLCYTGSKEHNIYLNKVAQEMGLHIVAGHGVYRGENLIASATEHEFFAALNLPFIKPEDRER